MSAAFGAAIEKEKSGPHGFVPLFHCENFTPQFARAASLTEASEKRIAVADAFAGVQKNTAGLLLPADESRIDAA